MFGATLLVHLFSVLIGQILWLKWPLFWINILAGLVFIGFGLWKLRGDEINDEEQMGDNASAHS
jgi:putative Ca2+/H+ antiporter (TMEM165/GDT1 family)